MQSYSEDFKKGLINPDGILRLIREIFNDQNNSIMNKASKITCALEMLE